MPEAEKNVLKNSINNAAEIDDDDEDGSKAEDGDYEDVRCFDEENDLVLTKKDGNRGSGNSPAKPAATNSRISDKKREATANAVPSEAFQGDSSEELATVTRIVAIPWPAAAGKRPPRDMKRLQPHEWYIVCKVMKWGDTPALFVRSSTTADTDFGFYKPPAQFYTYHFQVGDRLQLSQIGYSSSRNKVATSIRVKATQMLPLPEQKLKWIEPPISEVMPSTETKSKKKEKMSAASMPEYGSNPSMIGSSSSPKKKKLKEAHHQMPTLPMSNTAADFAALAQSMSHTSRNSLQHKKKEMPFLQSFGPGSLAHSQASALNVAGQLFFPNPGTPDINRTTSFGIFTSMADFFNNSSQNLLAPPSPNLLGSNSPLIGGQPSMHRIPSGGFSSFGSISSPSTNCPPFLGFPSSSNLNYGTSADQTGGN